jgi:hypothetical protein
VFFFFLSLYWFSPIVFGEGMRLRVGEGEDRLELMSG